MEVFIVKMDGYKEVNLIIRNNSYLDAIEKLIDCAKGKCECYNLYCDCANSRECNCDCVNYKVIFEEISS